MTHTFCFTGMDRAEQVQLEALFKQASARARSPWHLAPEADAGTLVIDVDSTSGHMAWLKLRNSGCTVVALTAGSHSVADHLLRRPVDADAMTALLHQLDARIPIAPIDAAAPAESIAPVPADAAEPPSPLASDPDVTLDVTTTGMTPELPPEPPTPPRDPTLLDALQPGALSGPVRLDLPDAPPLVLDPTGNSYLGGAALKPYLPYTQRVIHADDWRAVSAAELERLVTELGGRQPLARLHWLAALGAGDGTLAPDCDPDAHYQLTRWPQSEREFPRHFRIATAMMKGPAPLDEIAQASGVPLAEVIDFVNAYLATGHAQMLAPPATEPDLKPPAGLMGRLRGLRRG